MAEKNLNTVYNFELADGEIVQMTLRYFNLYQLKSKNKQAYTNYNKIMIKGPEEELENVTILYTAYLCANLANIEMCMTEMEFLQRMPEDREYIGEILQSLINSKKK